MLASGDSYPVHINVVLFNFVSGGRDFRNFTEEFSIGPGGEDDRLSPRENPLYCHTTNFSIENDQRAEKTDDEYFFLFLYGDYISGVATLENHDQTLVYIADDDCKCLQTGLVYNLMAFYL